MSSGDKSASIKDPCLCMPKFQGTDCSLFRSYDCGNDSLVQLSSCCYLVFAVAAGANTFCHGPRVLNASPSFAKLRQASPSFAKLGSSPAHCSRPLSESLSNDWTNRWGLEDTKTFARDLARDLSHLPCLVVVYLHLLETMSYFLLLV